MAGGNDEREQTLNQMLVEMDGFVGNPGVIVMAATNRIDILDDALLRPGRFDRRVLVDLPNFTGRVAILKVHARGKPLASDVDIEGIARRTPGFSGAQLKNLMNEAAIFAARKKRPVPSIEWEDVDAAVDRLLVGLEKKGARQSEEMRNIVAYHEAGHAIVGALMPDYDSVQKVTIVPRTNGAGGLTFFSPSEERLECGLYSKVYMESQLAVALGGRLAEEIIYGEDQVGTMRSIVCMCVSRQLLLVTQALHTRESSISTLVSLTTLPRLEECNPSIFVSFLLFSFNVEKKVLPPELPLRQFH